MTDGAWDLLVERDDLSRTELVQAPAPKIVTGDVLLSIDRVGVTANNVTYARVGEAMNYWAFFPARAGWGRVPLWGFADIVLSESPAVDVGTRVYGYLPTSSHLVVRPERADAAGFRDASPHRVDLPRPYNVYATTAGDPAYEAEREDLQILYRPLFITSFMLDDFLGDNDFFGADVVVVSSASSKTSYGMAFCTSLRPKRPRLVGLTSASNVPFTESLNLYDEVVAYDGVTSLSTDRPALYVDVTGNIGLRRTIHSHLDEKLVYDAAVGMTHLDAPWSGGAEVPGVRPEFFFAPVQMAKRREDWGPGGIEERHAQLWREFAPVVEGWVDIVESTGPEGLREAWLEVLSGRADPRAGHVISL